MSKEEQRRLLEPERAIVQLNQRPINTVTEQELRALLRRYNLREGLIALGRISRLIFSNKDPKTAIGKSVYVDPDTGAMVSQFCLAYFANLLIMSGTNDHKRDTLAKPDNIQTLCNIYGHCLLDPALDQKKGSEWSKTLMVHLYHEQMPSHQYDPHYMMARAIVMFRDIVPKTTRPNIEPLTEILREKAELEPMDYLRLGFLIYAAAKDEACFNIDYLTNTSSVELKPALTDQKVKSFLAMVSADYKTFREEDERQNAGLDPHLTKYRFNPLFVYPVIKTQRGDKSYVIPNLTIYLRKAYEGLYWWFHHYFEKLGRQEEFRHYFGDVFEKYVGVILEQIYGVSNVQGEIVYGRKQPHRFIDWVVEKNNKVYLFEAKAYQFGLEALRSAEPEVLRREIDKKVVTAIKQVYKRLQDIERYDELAHLRDKKLIPVIVFWDIPLISAGLFSDWVQESLKAIAAEKGFEGIENFAPHLLNIEELESYDAVVDTIELEDVFAAYKAAPGEGFMSIVAKHRPSGRPRNRFLQAITDTFWQEAYGMAPDPKK